MREGTYERTPIWGDVIPGNSTRSKLEDMTIDFDADPQKNQIKFALLIGKYLGNVFFDCKKAIDTATWCNCMEPGYCEQTYTDVPGIVPFLCEGSDRAVILIPGGGYAFTGDLTAKIRKRPTNWRDGSMNAASPRSASTTDITPTASPFPFSTSSGPSVSSASMRRSTDWIRRRSPSWAALPEGTRSQAF